MSHQPDPSYGEKLRRFWFEDLHSLWWLLMALPALYFFQTFIHEGMHSLFNLFETGKLAKFATYPHISSSAGFRNGVTFDSNGFPAAPQFVAFGVILALILVFIFAPIQNRTTRFLLRTMFFGVCLDLLYNISRGLYGGVNPFADWSKFKIEHDIPTAAYIMITWIFWLVVLSHFLWVMISAWVRENPPKKKFWDFPWIGFVCGLMSLTALIFVAAVSDPSIDRGQGLVVAYVIMQLLALGWYTTYFIIALKRRS